MESHKYFLDTMTSIPVIYKGILKANLRFILLVITMILIVWGFKLYFEAEDKQLLFLLYYDIRYLVIGIILGLITFFAVQKVKFRISYWHTFIWLIFGALVVIASFLLAFDKDKTDGDYSYLLFPLWRTGQWIIFSLIIYIAFRFENRSGMRRWEKMIIPLYIVFGNLAIIALHDLYCSVVFTLIAVIGLLILSEKMSAALILVINIIIISLFVNDYKVAPVDGLHIPTLYESNLAGCRLHDSPFFLCEGPYNYYFNFDKSPGPEIYKGDMIHFIRLQYGYQGMIFLLFMYSIIVSIAIYSARKARHKSHSIILILLSVMFILFTLSGLVAAAVNEQILRNSEGLPFINASNSKQLFSIIFISAVYKELKNI